ncbi:glycosyltransferase family 2 protein [Bifidobacterium vansinderenii]|nr:glycosyltransferase family A protein [Bifidobacterium vansinderenii]
MTDQPLVTVVVPVYNAEAHLEQCVNSITGQTYRNIELVLVDDGSSDGSPAFCDHLVLTQRNAQVIHQSNQGVAAARNAGLQSSHGDYVMFVDSDDWLEYDAISTAVEQSEHDRLDLYVMGYRRVLEHGEGTAPELIEVTGDDALHTIDDVRSERCQNELCSLDAAGFLYSCWGKLFRREWVGDVRFREGDSYGEDSIFVMDCLEHGGRVLVGSAPFYDYREQATGLVRGFRASKPDDIAVLHERLLSFYDRSVLNAGNLAFQQRRCAEDVLWAMDTAFGAKPDVTVGQRLEFLTRLSNVPSRGFCLKGAKKAASSRELKVLFLLNSKVLWKAYLERRLRNA